jgi:hypothetical protein
VSLSTAQSGHSVLTVCATAAGTSDIFIFTSFAPPCVAQAVLMAEINIMIKVNKIF